MRTTRSSNLDTAASARASGCLRLYLATVIKWRLVQGVTPPSAQTRLSLAPANYVVRCGAVQGSGAMDNEWTEFIRRLERHTAA